MGRWWIRSLLLGGWSGGGGGEVMLYIHISSHTHTHTYKHTHTHTHHTNTHTHDVVVIQPKREKERSLDPWALCTSPPSPPPFSAPAGLWLQIPGCTFTGPFAPASGVIGEGGGGGSLYRSVYRHMPIMETDARDRRLLRLQDFKSKAHNLACHKTSWADQARCSHETANFQSW